MLNLRSPGLWLFVGGLEMLFLVHVAEFLYPGYSVSQDYISKLGVGPTDVRVVFMVAVMLFGSMAIVAAALLRKMPQKSRVWLFLGLSGIGAIGVAIFDMDAFSGAHSIFALMAFLFGNLAVIFSYKLVRAPISWLFVVLGLIGLSALALFGAHAFLGIGQGGMERLILYPPMFWALGFGAYMLAEEKAASSRSPST
jgi:hypothetical membrane protein